MSVNVLSTTYLTYGIAWISNLYQLIIWVGLYTSRDKILISGIEFQDKLKLTYIFFICMTSAACWFSYEMIIYGRPDKLVSTILSTSNLPLLAGIKMYVKPIPRGLHCYEAGSFYSIISRSRS